MMKRLVACVIMLLATPLLAKNNPPSMPGVDAPELAGLGPDTVGFKTLTYIHRAQPNLQSADPKADNIPMHDRKLVVDIWYPAVAKKGAKRMIYRAAFWGEPPKPPVTFTAPGLAVLNAKATGSAHPLVIVSHGYSNAPADRKSVV